ncbi:FAD-dependent oxidoreductase [Chlorobium phaeobacteroides]|uniref:Ferredoxin n=1 Tax=Chlorobium phaeobacteroides (strain DSM 266 / SMG 266 / 2430) TaxID=290317 RepID=A1BDJ4_CHLPD|nr:FAD-dependent oxidoreductase [Chlorobium phaeobacteroides]ABL64471.1 ferredoxin [Chlorobium phaeobacteroides DSM 266]MBV5319762.1 FAD-dependent oxidoreductase [Chlorobium phaeobacteroides]
MNALTLTINGLKTTVQPGTSILDAAASCGITIPTLCFQQSLDVQGACWICIVEIKGKNRFVPACSTKVSAGMVIETETEELHMMRRRTLERLIEQHCGDCLGQCELACPAGCNIPGFISEIAAHHDDEAIAIIKNTIPLPGILGRVCPAPCEDACRRHGVDDPVSICALKRYAADRDMEASERYIPAIAEKSGKHVAVIGAGPAGLTAAYYLLALGHEVTIYDEHPAAGGMMRYGIPRFRLPESVIDKDVEPLEQMGATFRFNTRFGKDISTASLQSAFDAIFLAVGAQQAAAMHIPGEHETGVLSGIEFLRQANEGVAEHPGANVVVVGGGNTAVDAARTALRLGATTVTILYRRTKEEMPANQQEINEAIAEGITLHVLALPVSMRRMNGFTEITAIAMRQGEPDESGRKKPVPINGSEFTIAANTVISATGQQVDCSIAMAAGIGTSPEGTFDVNQATLQSNIAGIFSAGDCVTGPDLAITAVSEGRRAAHSIHLFLQGKPVVGKPQQFNSSYGPRDQAPEAFYSKANPFEKIALPEISLLERSGTFREVVLGLSPEDAAQEALRCLQCRCNAIDNCRLRELAALYLPSGSCKLEEKLDFEIISGTDIRIEREKCVDCGICVRTLEQYGTEHEPDYQKLSTSCPTGALSEAMLNKK